MAYTPNRFSSRSQPDGRRVDQNFRALEDSLSLTDGTVATLGSDLTALGGDVVSLSGDLTALGADVVANTTDIGVLDAALTALDDALILVENDVADLQAGSFCSLYRPTLAIPDSTVTNITYSEEHYDVGGWHNFTNAERLICPVDGYYTCQASAAYGTGAFTAGTTRASLWIWSSRDSTLVGHDIIVPASGVRLGAASPIRYMAAGDYFVAQTYHNAGVARNVTSHFSGHLVGLG